MLQSCFNCADIVWKLVIYRCNTATVIFGYINAHDHSPPFGMKVGYWYPACSKTWDDSLSSLTDTYSHVTFVDSSSTYTCYRMFYAQDAESESEKTVEVRTKPLRQNQSKTAP
eukprot:scaffold231538_cov71-Attheya_sp.AAC.1